MSLRFPRGPFQHVRIHIHRQRRVYVLSITAASGKLNGVFHPLRRPLLAMNPSRIKN
jgi:hypothetical protein